MSAEPATASRITIDSANFRHFVGRESMPLKTVRVDPCWTLQRVGTLARLTCDFTVVLEANDRRATSFAWRSMARRSATDCSTARMTWSAKRQTCRERRWLMLGHDGMKSTSRDPIVQDMTDFRCARDKTVSSVLRSANSPAQITRFALRLPSSTCARDTMSPTRRRNSVG